MNYTDLTVEDKYSLIVGTALECDPPDDIHYGYIRSPWESIKHLRSVADGWFKCYARAQKTLTEVIEERDKRYHLSTKELIEKIESFRVADTEILASTLQYDEGYNQAINDILDGIVLVKD